LAPIRKNVEWRLYYFLYVLAFFHRLLLRRTVFIGITGSVGKTTTKELVAGILEHHLRGGRKNPGTRNYPKDLARLVLSTRSSAPYCVAEIALSHAFRIGLPLAFFRPKIGVVINVGDDHKAAYGSRDAIANEKGKLIRSLPPAGIAVLNADDPLVLAMRSQFSGRTVTYGMSQDAMLRAEAVEASWPDRLSFTVKWSGQSVRVQTQLCGKHWVSVVLAALATVVAAGMPLAKAAEAIADIEPFEGRMSPVQLGDDVTFIRDDMKSSLWTIDACLDFMRTARAARKIIVIGQLSEAGARKGMKYARIAARAQEIADIVIFVGPWSFSALKASQSESAKVLRAFSHVRDAAEYVNSISRAGDLVLLKGSNEQDHLIRIILARSDAIACWREDCKRYLFCDACQYRDQASGPAASLQTKTNKEAAESIPAILGDTLNSDEQIIVGLGNPESRYAGTPHNIGYEVVDRLAASLGFTWEKSPDSWTARGSVKSTRLCLVKIQKPMNLIGAELKHLSERMLFSPEQCILVFDDLDLAMGSVRCRLNGSAGGHRGVASILEAFQTDVFRRIKIGVRKSEGKVNRVEYVLRAFDTSERAAIDRAIPEAEARVLELATKSQNRIASPVK
jgi:UDP-N-acetylmuramoyl-tripeptide--D-alanyl-D-alanine ligase